MSHLSAKQRMLTQQSGSQIVSLFTPEQGTREDMKRLGISPPDYMAQHKKLLKEQQQRNREAQDLGNTKPQKSVCMQQKYSNIHSRVMESRERQPSLVTAFLKKREPQEAPADDEENQQEEDEDVLNFSSHAHVPLHSFPDKSSEASSKNFVRDNALAAARTAAKRQIRQAPAQFVQKKEYGKVPDYLKERKSRAREAQERILREEEEGRVPPGMVLMPEDERVETLALLRVKQGEVEAQLRHLPLKIETMGQRQRLADLEKALEDINNAISTFSKERVLISAD